MERAAEDPTGGEAGAGGDVTIDLCVFEVEVPLPQGDIVRVDPRRHRDSVVRRLLLLGASERTLTALLPEWNERIRRIADEFRTHGLL